MVRRTKTSYNKGRLRDLLWLMIQKYQPNCTICKKPITEDNLPTRGSDLLTEHHLDGNHENNDLANRVIVHRKCHKAYHVVDNICSKDREFWRQFEGG